MAYFADLDAARQNKIYEALNSHVSEEAQALYEAALKVAKTRKKKLRCSGQYIGRWYPLLDAWMRGKVSNIEVRDALSLGWVEEDLYILVTL